MTYLSLGEAAKAAGVAKGTISKALKSGKLSYSEKTPAGYKIDTSELFRVFPRKPMETQQNERLATPVETVETALLQVRLEAAERRAATAEADRDAWREQAQRLALTDQRAGEHQDLKSGFWSRLRGRS
jgi:hypothetical protein